MIEQVQCPNCGEMLEVREDQLPLGYLRRERHGDRPQTFHLSGGGKLLHECVVQERADRSGLQTTAGGSEESEGQRVRVVGPTVKLGVMVVVICVGLASLGLFLDRARATGASHFTLTVETPAQMHNEATGPAYLPATLSLPANATVVMTVYDFDDATALPAQYAKAVGIKGPMTIQALNLENPNAPGPSHTATVLDAKTEVGHTFTIPALGLNVPIAADSKVTFTFHTPKRGTYSWRCMDPCGPGVSGWGGAMATNGWMQGTITFT